MTKILLVLIITLSANFAFAVPEFTSKEATGYLNKTYEQAKTEVIKKGYKFPSQQRLLPSQCVGQGRCVLRSNKHNQPGATSSAMLQRPGERRCWKEEKLSFFHGWQLFHPRLRHTDE